LSLLQPDFRLLGILKDNKKVGKKIIGNDEKIIDAKIADFRDIADQGEVVGNML